MTSFLDAGLNFMDSQSSLSVPAQPLSRDTSSYCSGSSKYTSPSNTLLQTIPLAASSGSGLLVNVLTQTLDCGLATWTSCHCVGSHSDISSVLDSDIPVLDDLAHVEERRFDVGSVLGGCLEERDTKLIGKGLKLALSFMFLTLATE